MEPVNAHIIRQRQTKAWRESLALRYQIRHPKPDWHKQAACRGLDVDLFFNETGLGGMYATEICKTCPVLLDCGAAAWQEESSGDYAFGTRAGMPANARKTLYLSIRKQSVGWINHPSWR